MRIVIPNNQMLHFHSSLAREIGLEVSVVLLTLEREIAERGMDKDGSRMAARDSKQLSIMLPWLSVAQARKALESLQSKDFIFITDTLSKDSKWYALNWRKLKTLESIVVLGDGDIDDAHEQIIVPKQVKEDNVPQLHRDLLPVVIKMSNLTQPLTPRDAKEAWDFIRKITAKYTEEDFGRLQKRILGMRVWQESRKVGREKFTAPKPLTAWSNWSRYGDFCRENYNGNLPPIPAEWIEETGRR